ncbi:MAG: hypothetical protein A2Y33_04560 [Spirochaetes bacterium GWF1_51_8]|nr:MAG: hypothetical protein A2Y33_04560 [Spirochaetes bacterium GWF1_51_8]
MEKIGVVIGTKDDTTLVQLGLAEINNCGGCKLHGVCKPAKGGSIVEVPGKSAFPAGTQVVISMRESRAIFASFFLFIFPIVSAILGFLLFRSMGFPEGICIIMSVVFLIASIGIFLAVERLFMKNIRITRLDDKTGTPAAGC